MTQRRTLFPVPDLEAVAKRVKADPYVTIYFPRTTANILICPHAIDQNGLRVEQGQPVVVPTNGPDESLGETVWQALLLMTRVPAMNLRDRIKSDWPAYVVSGFKTLRAFEDEFIRVSITFHNCLRIEATVPEGGAVGLFVGKELSPACEFEKLGDAIRPACRCSVELAEREFS